MNKVRTPPSCTKSFQKCTGYAEVVHYLLISNVHYTVPGSTLCTGTTLDFSTPSFSSVNCCKNQNNEPSAYRTPLNSIRNSQRRAEDRISISERSASKVTQCHPSIFVCWFLTNRKCSFYEITHFHRFFCAKPPRMGTDRSIPPNPARTWALHPGTTVRFVLEQVYTVPTPICRFFLS